MHIHETYIFHLPGTRRYSDIHILNNVNFGRHTVYSLFDFRVETQELAPTVLKISLQFYL